MARTSESLAADTLARSFSSRREGNSRNTVRVKIRGGSRTVFSLALSPEEEEVRARTGERQSHREQQGCYGAPVIRLPRHVVNYVVTVLLSPSFTVVVVVVGRRVHTTFHNNVPFLSDYCSFRCRLLRTIQRTKNRGKVALESKRKLATLTIVHV